MKKNLQSFVRLLAVFMVAQTVVAAPVQVADGVYRDGSTLYITSGVTSLGALNFNPSVIYCFAAVPPLCESNTFTAYDAMLHIPSTSYAAYFVNDYWSNFADMFNDAVEPTEVALNNTEANLITGDVLTLTATIVPSNASLRTVTWSSSNPSVATVNGGKVTALAAGECDIVASCLDKQDVCHVKVIETTIIITLDMHEVSLLPNHSLTLKPTMTPLETDLNVTLSNPQVAVARLVNGVVQIVGVSEGSTMVEVSSVDGMAQPDSCLVTVYTELGDVNCDGFINIADLTSLIDHMLGTDASTFKVENADTNGDGEVNIADVTELIDYLLVGHWSGDVVPHENDWVDLGLPSGTLWATMNVGANSPEEYGDYFAWGETTPKDVYDWSTYKWCKGSDHTMTKYCTSSSYGFNGFVDNKTELDPEDDAAYVNWGPSWCMPTLDQLYELKDECTWTKKTQNGIYGCLVTGPNGNTMFLPAAGYQNGGALENVNSWGYYWSSTLRTTASNNAHILYFYSNTPLRADVYRENGRSVRAVRCTTQK